MYTVLSIKATGKKYNCANITEKTGRVRLGWVGLGWVGLG
jgi:hypothetical protein